mmetsp:Transcript_75987/g.167718  ORF Transcript_75987/g.167718 Transcript_75987/m.167718 type:complete len:239 (-) Transcript_75987:543-1259(-)
MDNKSDKKSTSGGRKKCSLCSSALNTSCVIPNVRRPTQTPAAYCPGLPGFLTMNLHFRRAERLTPCPNLLLDHEVPGRQPFQYCLPQALRFPPSGRIDSSQFPDSRTDPFPHEAQDREVPKAKAFRAASKALRFQGPSFPDDLCQRACQQDPTFSVVSVRRKCWERAGTMSMKVAQAVERRPELPNLLHLGHPVDPVSSANLRAEGAPFLMEDCVLLVQPWEVSLHLVSAGHPSYLSL